MNFKKISILMAIVMTILTMSVSAKTMQFTINDVNALVDDEKITTYPMEAAPYIVDGRTLVPVRIVAETFNADVQWIESERKVVITLADKTISMVIGEAAADVNGTAVALDVPSVISNGRTMVPLRFVSETLGFDVSYVDVSKQILITDDPAVVEFNGEKISLEEYRALYKDLRMGYPDATEEELNAVNKFLALSLAVRVSEAKKFGVTVSDRETILKDGEYVSSMYGEEFLPAVWISLFDKDSLAINTEKFLAQLYMPNEAEAQTYYEENYLKAKHILILHDDTAENDIKKIKIKLNQGANFDDLMNEFSEDPGLQAYPDGYIFGLGEFHKEFEDATRKLMVGKVSDIIETSDGYHIIKRLPLDAYNEIAYNSVATSCALISLENHLTDVVNNGEVKYNYTDEELSKLVK